MRWLRVAAFLTGYTTRRIAQSVAHLFSRQCRILQSRRLK